MSSKWCDFYPHHWILLWRQFHTIEYYYRNTVALHVLRELVLSRFAIAFHSVCVQWAWMLLTALYQNLGLALNRPFATELSSTTAILFLFKYKKKNKKKNRMQHARITAQFCNIYVHRKQALQRARIELETFDHNSSTLTITPTWCAHHSNFFFWQLTSNIQTLLL